MLVVEPQVVPLRTTPGTSRRTIVADRLKRVEDGLRRLPGVTAVATGSPPIGTQQVRSLAAGRVVETRFGVAERRIGILTGGAELVQALGIPLLEGRYLEGTDSAGRPRPALVSSSLAHLLWPDRSPLNEVVTIDGSSTYIIVGVTAEVAFGSLADVAVGILATVQPQSGGRFIVRAGNPESLAQEVGQLINSVVGEVAYLKIDTGKEIVRRDVSQQWLGSWFFSGFGLIALLLGAGGAFGLVAYLVESHRREYGLRVALGASASRLVRHAMATLMAPVFLGDRKSVV